MVRVRRTRSIVPRSGLGTTRTVAEPVGFGPGRARPRMGRVSNIVNEWAHAEDAQVVPGNALVDPGCARPTFKEVTRK